jgi:urease subunit alpha
VQQQVRSTRAFLPVQGCRGLTKHDLVLNEATPPIEVDPGTGRVYLDGVELTCDPVREFSLNRRYFLS